MVKQVLRRVKTLLGIDSSEHDVELIYTIEQAITQIETYIHQPVKECMIPIIAKLACHNYDSGEAEGGSSGAATVGEVKKESYSGVSFEYTTSADFTDNSSSSSSSDSSYFSVNIAPSLNQFRKVMVIR